MSSIRIVVPDSHVEMVFARPTAAVTVTTVPDLMTRVVAIREGVAAAAAPDAPRTVVSTAPSGTATRGNTFPIVCTFLPRELTANASAEWGRKTSCARRKGP